MAGFRRSLLLVMFASCGQLAAPPPASLPWVSGFRASAVAEESAHLDPRASTLVDPSDDPMAVQADVRGGGSAELVVASAHGGVRIVDARGRVVAQSDETPFEGSADDLIALAIGDAHLGSPVILAALQHGGHRSNVVSLDVFRVNGGRLERVFEAPIETHDGAASAAGAVFFADGALVYRAPGAQDPTTWSFDPVLRRYVRAP